MTPLRRRGLRLAAAWAALLLLMATSLASAYLPLGPWNLVVGLAVAALKSSIVLAFFMGLRRAPATLRLAAALGFATLALLFALSGLDWATRDAHPAAVQQPRQLATPAAQGASG